MDDILDDIKKCNDDDNQIIKYIYDDDLVCILKDMVYSTPSYIPDVNFNCGKIKSLKFKINGILGVIENSTDNENDKDVYLGPNIYKKYHEAFNKFYSSIVCEEHMSTYNPLNIEIESEYHMVPQTGYFSDDDVCNDKYNGIDSRKAYTSDLYDIEYYPVYGYFDIWKKYDDHKIEDYNQYIVECIDKNELSLLLFPYKYSRCTGYKLNRINVKYSILFFKRPSKLVQSNSKEIIDELWKTKFDDECDNQCKKDIVNLNIGLLGKKYNNKTISKIFKNYDEASYYSCQYALLRICQIMEMKKWKYLEGYKIYFYLKKNIKQS